MSSPSERRAIAACVGLGVLHLVRFANPVHTVDDAYISFRYARNLVEHGELSFNLGESVEGFTNLSWTLLSALFVGSGDPIAPMRLIGWALFVATIALVAWLGVRLCGHWRGAMAGLLVAGSGSMAFWAGAGLETPLVGFLFVAGLAALEVRRPWLAGAALGLLVLSRPEGLLAAALLVVLWRSWRAGLLVVACAIGLEVFRLSVYGEWLPNTFYAKPPSSSGLVYGAWWLVAIGGPVALFTRRWRLLAVAGVLGLGAVATGGDWMPGLRRLTMASLAVFLAVGSDRRTALAAPVLAGSLLMAGLGLDKGAWFHEKWAMLGALAQDSAEVDTICTYDIGRVGWTFRGRVMDLGGLTDAHVARLPGTHGEKAWDEAWFRAGDPDLVFVSLGEGELRRVDQQVVGSMQRGGFVLHHTVAMAGSSEVQVWRREDLVLDGRWGR